MNHSAPLSRTALRAASAIGAVITLIGVVLIGVMVVAWQPLSAAPAWVVTLTGVVLVTGIVSTVIFSTTLARRQRR
ncbi:hypothetical protein [Microbacterium enclense]|uniref:hypothetical protein n=1 Tax=Microbacterium enclense TaxID=993073 RepID=UPI003F82330A